MRRAARPEELTVAITFEPASGEPGPSTLGFPTTGAALGRLRPDPLAVDRALYELTRLGFTVTGRSGFTASARVGCGVFERLFGTTLEPHSLPHGRQPRRFLFPGKGAAWSPRAELTEIVNDVHVQWPVAPATIAATAPPPGTGMLDLPGLCRLLKVDQARANTRAAGGEVSGRGVRVAMVDSGFDFSHPFFSRVNAAVLGAPFVSDPRRDGDGHGTAMSANIFAVAPEVEFLGVSLGITSSATNEAALIEGVQEALRHRPRILVLSLVHDLFDPVEGEPLTFLPGSCKPLALALQEAVASGVAVVCAAGNGEYAFPAMLPEVLAVGGITPTADGGLAASDLTSAFRSAVYPGRIVPDVCGVAGSKTRRACLCLPCPAGSALDQACAVYPDGTEIGDGWCFASGSSMAAPQVAGVLALLLEVRPDLAPDDLASVLRRTAREVTPLIAAADRSPGAGLVDADAALRLVGSAAGQA